MNIALEDADVTTHFISRWNATVSQTVVIEGIATHRHLEFFVLRPLPVFLQAYRKGERSATVLCGQLVPVVHIEVSPLAVCMQLTAF